MTSTTRKNGDGLAMRQTLALGLLAGLGATVVHALICDANVTRGNEGNPATLPLHSFGETSIPTAGKMRFSLFVRPAPNFPDNESEATSDPAEPQASASLPNNSPALLWRL